MKRSKGKGKGKSRRTGRAFFGDEQARDLELWSEEDFARWSKGKKGKNGLSKGNDGFRKGGFRPYQPDTGAGKDKNQNKGKGKDQKGMEGAYPQSGLSASESPNEEGYGHTWESDDWSDSHWPDHSWTSDAGWFCSKAHTAGMVATPLNFGQPSNTRGSGLRLHTAEWIKRGNRKVQEACMALWYYDGILTLS